MEGWKDGRMDESPSIKDPMVHPRPVALAIKLTLTQKPIPNFEFSAPLW
jgi:hypothetical protein